MICLLCNTYSRNPSESQASNPETTIPFSIRSILTPSTATLLPVAACPRYSPLWVPVRCHIVTTVFPSALISSTAKLVSGNASHQLRHCKRNDSRPTTNFGSLPAASSAINRSIADSSPLFH